MTAFKQKRQGPEKITGSGNFSMVLQRSSNELNLSRIVHGFSACAVAVSELSDKINWFNG